ncbi:Riboflavin biosynthesis protein RibF [Frankia canadensis]|uniref:Riboflavin biosynthesis protein n=1 Tax=Frankia canadensis TaxID=1836972 RepID=A0A2I2KTX3_9ACTN|nr:bifunctional riboflavin kinase/FAD synthetase [Frankia canadensis]SNQ49099.1 Riboflavin biosynthesis protein RibF [Frankia canadensis]SOU56389.1 Riboflavin biosynthesis protein RibF [Frankia canadensis]
MQTWRGAENTPADWDGGVVTIGFFDGVHLGHRQIIGRAVARARERGERSLVLTFDPHPGEVLRPGSHPALLTTLRFKAELLAAIGVDAMCVQPFTLGFSKVSAAGFVREVLVERLRASVVVVGENFSYGHRAAGRLASLEAAGAREGFEVDGVRLVRVGEQVMSSTAIRSRVADGDVEAAAAALDRPHRVEGVVVHGDARGRTIGYPTANVDVTPWAAVPADGVYAGFACWDGRRQPAAISIGTNPTFAGRERRVEAFLLDFDGDLYGQYMAYEFTHRLRPTLRFESVDELVTQMAADVEATRELTLTV